MKTIGIVPIKETSRRVKGKNFREFKGLPLYEHFFRNVLSENLFDELYVDTDSRLIKQSALSRGFRVIDRPPELAGDSANGNDLLLYEAGIVEADLYFQLFITAPFLKTETIRSSLNFLRNNREYDSLFTVNEIYSWFWFRGNPVNYEPTELPRSQDAEPIIRETTGLYAIYRDVLLERKCRIGYKPCFWPVDEIEGMDLDSELDFFTAERTADYLEEKREKGIDGPGKK